MTPLIDACPKVATHFPHIWRSISLNFLGACWQVERGGAAGAAARVNFGPFSFRSIPFAMVRRT